MSQTRIEKDFLGQLEVPADAYYGIQTVRAVNNFPISGLLMPAIFIKACAEIKKAAALVHNELGALETDKAEAIIQAAEEIIRGEFNDQFVVDIFQAGAGTSFHMNMNEVLANRASELLGGQRGEYKVVHPNDHVNMGQSTNDLFPTAMRLAALFILPELTTTLALLADALGKKASSFSTVAKSGRTHLQDAVPVTLGHEFGAYAAAIRKGANYVDDQIETLKQLGIGGSATGTGLNTLPGYRDRIIHALSEQTGLSLSPADNLFEAMQSMAPFVKASGTLRLLAVELGRMANDLRLLSSGPTTGLAEIQLPAVQPGSSIMPGKVNPVIAECMNMICFQVIGNDTCLAQAAGAGQLELNVMMPVINYNFLWSIQILTNGITMFREKCIEGISPNKERCHEYFSSTLGLATVLNPVIGYHSAAEIVREAAASSKSIKEIVLKKGALDEEKFDELLLQSVKNED